MAVSLLGVMPIESLPFVILGSSLVLGTIGSKILDNKIKPKERLKSFTTASTEVEKIEEEVKYAIELEKDKIEINKIITKLNNEINIGFGSVDIIKTIDDKFYIMEINSGVMMDNFINQK
jgi:hypothetical protein